MKPSFSFTFIGVREGVVGKINLHMKEPSGELSGMAERLHTGLKKEILLRRIIPEREWKIIGR